MSEQDAAAQAAADAEANDSVGNQTFPLSYVQELRQENAALRVRSTEEVKAVKDALAASEAKHTEELAAAHSLVKTASINAAVTVTAAKLGFVDPEDAAKLMDSSKVTFEDGKVQGVDDALKSLADTKPHLLGSRAAGDGPDKKDHKKPSDINAAIRKQAGVTPT